MDIWSIRDTSPGRLSFSSPRTRRGDFVRGFSDSPPTRQSPACRARASRYLPRSSRRLPKVGQLSKPGVYTQNPSNCSRLVRNEPFPNFARYGVVSGFRASRLFVIKPAEKLLMHNAAHIVRAARTFELGNDCAHLRFVLVFGSPSGR